MREPRRQAWRALTHWMGGLLDDRAAVHVRCNLAMLAADLAPHDEEALEELARMAAQAIDEIARRDSEGDRTVLDTLLRERASLPESVRKQLDANLADRLEAQSRGWRLNEASDALLRSEVSAAFLPVAFMADVVVVNARRLATLEPGAPERDDAQRRLHWLTTADATAPDQVRSKCRGFITSGLASVPKRERRLALFALLRAAPSFLDSAADGTVVARPAELDAAARAGRPRRRWLAWQALLGAVLGGGALALTMALFLLIVLGRPSAIENALLESWGALWVIGALPGLLAGWCYTPSVGRRQGLARGALHGLLPAAVGAIGVIALVWDNIKYNPNIIGLQSESAPDVALRFTAQFAASVLVLFAVTKLAPLFTRIARGPTSDAAAVVATLSVAGPAIAAATALCGLSLLFKETGLAQLWPALIAAVAGTSSAVMSAELETSPSLRQEPPARASALLRFGLIACCVPLLLALVAYALSAMRVTDKVTLNSPQVTGPESGTSSALVMPGRGLTVAVNPYASRWMRIGTRSSIRPWTVSRRVSSWAASSD